MKLKLILKLIKKRPRLKRNVFDLDSGEMITREEYNRRNWGEIRKGNGKN